MTMRSGAKTCSAEGGIEDVLHVEPKVEGRLIGDREHVLGGDGAGDLAAQVVDGDAAAEAMRDCGVWG
jgi:hypothetical protein